MTHTADDLRGLGAKLDALELTDAECVALHAIFDAAIPDEEVEGYGMLTPTARPAFGLRLQSPAANNVFDAHFDSIHDIHMNQGNVSE